MSMFDDHIAELCTEGVDYKISGEIQIGIHNNEKTVKHDAYLETIQNMCGPYKPGDIPKIKMNLRELVKYAKSINKKVPELSDEEINRYILCATMDDVRNVRIIVSGAEYAN